MSRKGRAIKVHSFRGAKVDDLKHHAISLLHQEPSFVIIRAGTKDAPNSTSRKILHNLLTLKCFITDNLPRCKVVISTPTLHTADGKAVFTVRQLTHHLLQLDIHVIDNTNINTKPW